MVSLPVFIAEMSVGRRARTSSYGAMNKLKAGRIWHAAGVLSVIIPLVIASYYSVIGGWSLDYLWRSLGAEFVKSSPDAVTGIFGSFISTPGRPIVMHLVFLAACAMVVAGGVKGGIERFSKFSIPVLFVLILVMMVYSITLPGASSGISYLIKPDFSQIDARSFAYALGQSFYSLSLGMGTIITYGSYVDRKESLVASGTGTAISDILFALLAGLAIMPAVFAAGIEPGAGPGLIFQSIPFIFSSMGAESHLIAIIVSIVFFFTIVVAAMTSCISLLEVGVSFLGDHFGISRWKGSLLLFVLCGLVGVLCSLSFGPLSAYSVAGMGIFDLLDWFCSNVLLLVLAFAVVIFVGFVLPRESVREEVTNGGQLKISNRVFPVLYFLIKWVAPIAIAAIFVTNFIL